MEYNKYVKLWQDFMISHGIDLGESGADGLFGPITLKESAGLMKSVEQPEQPKLDTRKAICLANNFVNVRAGRGGNFNDFEDIGNVYAGQIVEVIDEDLEQEYIKIEWEDTVGYVYCNFGKYFKFCEDTEIPVSEKVQNFLEVVKEIAMPIDGQNAKYIYGGEGGKITRSYVLSRNKVHPNYFSNGRLEMLLKLADECEAKNEWIYPIHYSWDCSGLWWYGANKTKLYGYKELDSTAAGVYANYCDPIDKHELKPGDLVFYRSRSAGKIVHMGIVGEEGVVYEAMSGYTGVVICDSVDDRTATYLPGTHKEGQTLKRSAWTHFGRPKVFA